ncbi:MAG: alkaline phosphatase family protein [Rhodothermales bacterium]
MKLSTLSSVLLLALLAGCQPAPSPTPSGIEHVFVIGVDGMSPDGIRNADTPVMDRMMREGAYTLQARGVLPTSSSPNWASMISGAGPALHGVTSNDWEKEVHSLPPVVNGDETIFPTIFSLVHNQRPGAEVGAIYHWTGFGRLFEKQAVNYDRSPDTEDETAALAAAYIEDKKPTFAFVHFDHVDHAGHTYGHGTDAYYASVGRADSLIGVVLAAIENAGLLERSLIIVSADHGGIGLGHGGETTEELEIPFLMMGHGVKRGFAIEAPVNTTDNAATVAFALGLKTPYAWTGRPVASAFEGFSTPDLMYTAASYLRSPVIHPPRNGYDPAGGLYVDTQPTVRITNTADRGVIRYTLDGTKPTAASPIYDAPFTLDATTVVQATAFEEDAPISKMSTAYFRVLSQPASRGYGIRYAAYAVDDLSALPDVSRLRPDTRGTTYELSGAGLTLPRDEHVVIVFETNLAILEPGTYRFTTGSDDGSKLYVDGKEVVNNDGDHGVIERSGDMDLTAGRHALRVEWFNGGGGKWLGVFYEGPGVPRQIIPGDRMHR